jgi:hypothetical protein
MNPLRFCLFGVDVVRCAGLANHRRRRPCRWKRKCGRPRQSHGRSAGTAANGPAKLNATVGQSHRSTSATYWAARASMSARSPARCSSFSPASQNPRQCTSATAGPARIVLTLDATPPPDYYPIAVAGCERVCCPIGLPPGGGYFFLGASKWEAILKKRPQRMRQNRRR